MRGVLILSVALCAGCQSAYEHALERLDRHTQELDRLKKELDVLLEKYRAELASQRAADREALDRNSRKSADADAARRYWENSEKAMKEINGRYEAQIGELRQRIKLQSERVDHARSGAEFAR